MPTARVGTVLCLATVAFGCGASPLPASTNATPPVEPPPHAAAGPVEPRSATELALALQAIVSGGSGTVEDHVDHAFAERLPSGSPIDELFRGWPEGCVPRLSESPGYAAVAIPPPMDDDDPEETRRIEVLIDELRAATEVEASCTVIETYQDEADEPATPHEETRMLFAIAARADARGVFHALAWRDFRQDMPGNQ